MIVLSLREFPFHKNGMRSFVEELDMMRQAGLERKLTVHQGEGRMNFAANDYLGLASHPAVTSAFVAALHEYGNGATASRLICGTHAPHQLLEDDLAHAKNAEAALLFSTGYAAALGTVPALVGKDDVIILDKLSHASLIDAAKLSTAELRVFPHNDMSKLEKILRSVREKSSAQTRILIITEAVFSMDGDVCPLTEIVKLKNQYHALLMLDEAHSFGVLGHTGMGLAEEQNLQQEVDIQMGTLSKAAGLAGGFIACKKVIKDLLIHRARSFIYSTAPPPALASAAITALNIIRSSEGVALRAKLHENIALLCGLLDLPVSSSAIIPIILGENQKALDAAELLKNQGFLVPAIRYPTVPRHGARLRVSISALHEENEIHKLAEQLRSIITS